LPEHPTRLLLIVSELAAALCRQMQDEIIEDMTGTATARHWRIM